MLAYLPTYLYTCVPTYLLVSPSACLPFAYLATYVRTYPPSCLPAHLFTFYLPTYLHACAPNYLPAYLVICLPNLPACPSTCRADDLSAYLPAAWIRTCPSAYWPRYLPI